MKKEDQLFSNLALEWAKMKSPTALALYEIANERYPALITDMTNFGESSRYLTTMHRRKLTDIENVTILIDHNQVKLNKFAPVLRTAEALNTPLGGVAGGAVAGAALGVMLPAIALWKTGQALLKQKTYTTVENIKSSVITAGLLGVGVVAYSLLPVWAPLTMAAIAMNAGAVCGYLGLKKTLPSMIARDIAPKYMKYVKHRARLQGEAQILKMMSQDAKKMFDTASESTHQLRELSRELKGEDLESDLKNAISPQIARILVGRYDLSDQAAYGALEAKIEQKQTERRYPNLRVSMAKPFDFGLRP